MMQEPDEIEKIKTTYKFVDIVFGTHNIFKFAELIYDRLMSGSMIIDIWKDTNQIVEDLPDVRKFSFKSGVNIMYGCNNFCSYCIVPYVRGRERSREPKDIIREIERFVSEGVKEVMLLGQNVNSYGKNLEHPMTFAELLKEISLVEGLERIRFMTPHPKDLSDELIEVMATTDKICHHVHLPLQSGSSKILKAMNRHYTKESYLELVKKIRTRMPDAAITTDIIVGFPGETEEDFLDTLDVVNQSEFDSAFTFIYSKRTGTPAASMENQVPEDIVHERFNRLLQVVGETARERNARLLGQTGLVLAEEIDEKDSSMITGRLSNNNLVHFTAGPEVIGQIVPVVLEEAKGFYYIGRLDKDSEGLLLMTNNGDIINKMMRAGNYHEKEYKVTVNKEVTAEFVEQMSRGVHIVDKEKGLDAVTRPCKVEKIGKYKFKIILTQGLNRQIRRMSEALGYKVTELKRVRIMNIELGNLKPGEYRKLTDAELNGLHAMIQSSRSEPLKKDQ
jgi:tRNA-2-methylthio-N6-dimethylallyladenosine synthase